MNLQFPSALEQKVAGIWPGLQSLAVEGSTYIATNPTVGTGIAITTSVVDDAATASSTHAQFAPALIITNTTPAALGQSGKSIYPLYIKLITTAVPTSATAWNASFRLDNVANKYVSGGTQITPVNLNSNVGIATNAAVYFGALVPSGVMSSSGRVVGRTIIDTAVPVVGDTYIFNFASSSMGTNVLLGGTTTRNNTYPQAPVIIAPGWSLQLDLWGASNAAAAAYEFEIVYAER